MELYVENGKIGVLISHGYGAGWSTWNQKELAYDKEVIEYWLYLGQSELGLNIHKQSDLMEEFLANKNYENYTGGYTSLELYFVDFGESFYIYEVDGHEVLVRQDEMFKFDR